MQAYKTYFFHHFIVPWILHSMSAVMRSANEKKDRENQWENSM